MLPYLFKDLTVETILVTTVFLIPHVLLFW